MQALITKLIIQGQGGRHAFSLTELDALLCQHSNEWGQWNQTIKVNFITSLLGKEWLKFNYSWEVTLPEWMFNLEKK